MGSLLWLAVLSACAPEDAEPPAFDKPAQQVVLRLQDVTSDRRDIDGIKHLVIEGQVTNPSSEPQSVPPMVATLMDPDGTELKRWTFHAEATVVPAEGSVPFQTSTANPPVKGKLNLNFAGGGRARALEPSIVGDELRLQEVHTERRLIDGVEYLVVEGQITNPSSAPQSAPPVVATLMDPDGLVLKSWTFNAETTVVPAGGSVSFETSTANPPVEGKLNLNFSSLMQ